MPAPDTAEHRSFKFIYSGGLIISISINSPCIKIIQTFTHTHTEQISAAKQLIYVQFSLKIALWDAQSHNAKKLQLFFKHTTHLPTRLEQQIFQFHSHQKKGGIRGWAENNSWFLGLRPRRTPAINSTRGTETTETWNHIINTKLL